MIIDILLRSPPVMAVAFCVGLACAVAFALTFFWIATHHEP